MEEAQLTWEHRFSNVNCRFMHPARQDSWAHWTQEACVCRQVACRVHRLWVEMVPNSYAGAIIQEFKRLSLKAGFSALTFVVQKAKLWPFLPMPPEHIAVAKCTQSRENLMSPSDMGTHAWPVNCA